MHCSPGQEAPRTLDGSHISRLNQLLAEHEEDTDLADEMTSDEEGYSSTDNEHSIGNFGGASEDSGDLQASGHLSSLPRRLHSMSGVGVRSFLHSATSKTVQGIPEEEDDRPQAQQLR